MSKYLIVLSELFLALLHLLNYTEIFENIFRTRKENPKKLHRMEHILYISVDKQY